MKLAKKKARVQERRSRDVRGNEIAIGNGRKRNIGRGFAGQKGFEGKSLVDMAAGAIDGKGLVVQRRLAQRSDQKQDGENGPSDEEEPKQYLEPVSRFGLINPVHGSSSPVGFPLRVFRSYPDFRRRAKHLHAIPSRMAGIIPEERENI